MKLPVAFIAFAVATSSASAQVPLCQQLPERTPAPCYSAENINAAMVLLKRRGSKVSRDFVVTTDMQFGALDASDLARAVPSWTEHNDGKSK